MSVYLELAVSFAFGIITSLIAMYLHGKYQTMKRTVGLNIEGNWAEHIPDSKGHQFSHGKIYYDNKRKLYAFDGTNFRNDGKNYCYWDTVTSVVDTDLRKFFYTFTAQLEGELDKTYYGFGVINLGVDGSGLLAPINGHYISDNIDARGMSHSMLRTSSQYVRGEGGGRAIRSIESQLRKDRGRQQAKTQSSRGVKKISRRQYESQ